MAGHTTIANGATGLAVRTILNNEFTELFGENGKAYISVADITARDAIPAAYLTTGKLVYVVATDTLYEYNGATFDAKLWDHNGALSGKQGGTTGEYYHLTLSERKNILNEFSTGARSGFVISINTDTTKIDITAGKGKITDDTDPDNPTLTEVVYAGGTAIAVSGIGTDIATYIGIDATGTIIQQVTPFTQIQRRSIILLGAAIHSNKTTINAINNLPDVALSGIAQFNDLLDGLKNFNISGNVISANGANMSINKSIGTIFKRGSNFNNSISNPHTLTLAALTAPSNIRYRTQDGTEFGDTNLISAGYYDVGGTRTVLNSGFTIQRVTIFPSNLIRIQYGQASYNTMAVAIQNITTENFVVEQNINDNGLLRAIIVVRYNATDLTDPSQAVIYEADKFGSSRFSAGGAATTTMQQAYNNSLQPQIITSTASGAVQVKRGSAADTDKVLEALNGAGSSTMAVYGDGSISIGGAAPTSPLQVASIPAYASNALAISGGLTVGAFYRNGDNLCIVH